MRKVASRWLPGVVALALCVAGGWSAPAAGVCDRGEYTQDFRLEECSFSNSGRMPFFVLETGYWLRFEGEDREGFVELTITVLRDTELVDGVKTRVVEEREFVDGELVEVSRNFFAICAQTGSAVYFGEDVDNYENGIVVNHDGAWRAGVAGARAGVLMPGLFLLGSRYFQELAPGVALDRGCNAAMDLTESTPAGTFPGCVEVRETSPLEPGEVSTKAYCPGIGMVRDDTLRLVDWSERR